MSGGGACELHRYRQKTIVTYMSMNSFHARQGKPKPTAHAKGPADRHGLLRVDQLLVAQGLAPSRTAARALIEAGLQRLIARGARGCVVLGDPAYYARFGFIHDPALTFPGAPAEYFQRLVLRGDPPSGAVRYAPAFG